ncbi:MAG: YggS family pyridoxal phosphate-dependent enzyme [Beijerinckiaceae bacterium]
MLSTTGKLNSPRSFRETGTGPLSIIPPALADVRRRIALAAEDCGRNSRDVTLVCVSKSFAAAAIDPVLAAGERVFGENRVQEALEKWPPLKQAFEGVELHLIGPLQSNKAREAVQFFDVIETVDRVKIAETLAREIARLGRAPRLYVQVNTGSEPQKAGVLPLEADRFIASCVKDYGLTIEGLMCIPPADDQASPHFALLYKIASRNGLRVLSMGMSNDFELAIQLGATHVRVGSAIFGKR